MTSYFLTMSYRAKPSLQTYTHTQNLPESRLAHKEPSDPLLCPSTARVETGKNKKKVNW